MKKILIIGAGEMQVGSICKAKEMGLMVVAVDMNPDAPGFKYADFCEVISTNDIPAVVEVAEKYNISAVITCSDRPVRTVAAVAEKLGLPAISVENSFRATDKYLMREALKKNDVPIPFFTKASTYQEFVEAVNLIKNQGLKCIAKAADNSGSRGISLIEKFDDDSLIDIYNYCSSSSYSGEVVVEEYMVGPEVCVETLNYDGVCYPIQITDKLTTGAPYFVEMGHSQPSQHSQAIQDEIRRVAIAANMAIGNYNGSSCTEIKITDSGVKVVELGARLAGDYMTSDLVPLSTGVNMIESVIKIALGEKPDYVHKFEKASAIRFLEADEGIIESITGVEDAENVPGVVRVGLYVKIGDKSSVIHNSLERLGYVIAQANTAQAAVQICENAKSKILFKIK